MRMPGWTAPLCLFLATAPCSTGREVPTCIYLALDCRIDLSNEITQSFSDIETRRFGFGFSLQSPHVWPEEVSAVIWAKLLSEGGHTYPQFRVSNGSRRIISRTSGIVAEVRNVSFHPRNFQVCLADGATRATLAARVEADLEYLRVLGGVATARTAPWQMSTFRCCFSKPGRRAAAHPDDKTQQLAI